MKTNAFFSRLPGPLQRPPVAIGAAVLLGFLFYLLLRPAGEEGSATAYFEVRKGDFTVSVVEGGTLTAVEEIVIRNEVDGTARIIYIVPEGSYVKKGDLLVQLDAAQAEDQVNQQQIAVEKAQFALVQAEAQLKIQESSTNSDIRAAALKLKFAELDLKKYQEGEQLVKLFEASNNVVKTEAQLNVARTTYHYTTNLAERGYETKRAVDSDRLSVLNNEFSLLIASNNVWMLQAFDLPKQREQLESNVAEAGVDLMRVVAQSERRMAQYAADLLTQSNTLVLSQRKLDRDRKNLAATRVEAPQDGLVVYPVSENRFSQESLIEEGAVVRNRQELIKLPNIAKMKVTVKVHESHVNMVRSGLPAFVVLDSMPDIRFAGYVGKVALLPDTQSRFGNPNLKVYNTEVLVTDELPNVKPGVSARAEIVVTNITETVSVPIQAVTTLKGRQVVYLPSGTRPEPRPVEVGLFNTKFIQIVNGLKPGERVLLSPPFDTREKDLEGAVLAEDERARLATNQVRAAAPANAREPVVAGAPAPDLRPGLDGAAGNGSGNRTVGGNGGSAEGRMMGPGGRPGSGEGNVAEGAGEPRGPGQRGGNARGAGFNPEEMLKQFDKDGDGQLSEEERTAMRDTLRQRGGGQRGTGMPGFDREAMMKEFDKDGDGELNEEERTAMRETMRQRFGAGGRPGGASGAEGGAGGRENRREGGLQREGGQGPGGGGSPGGSDGAGGGASERRRAPAGGEGGGNRGNAP